MARKVVKLRLNRDGTWSVRVGRHIEHVGGDKLKPALFDAIKYAILSKDVYMSDVSIIELMDAARR